MTLLLALLLPSFGGAAESLIPCLDFLKPDPAVASVPRAQVTNKLDGWLQTWLAYRSPNPAADLIILVGSNNERGYLPRLLVTQSGLAGMFPGASLTNEAAEPWLDPSDVTIITEAVVKRKTHRARILAQANGASTCAADHVDSITVIDNPGLAKEVFWSPAPLGLIYVTGDDCFIRSRDSSLILGVRGTKRSVREWLERPLELLSEGEELTDGAALPAALLARVAAVYVTAPGARAGGKLN